MSFRRNARSNWFFVADEESFDELADRFSLYVERRADGAVRFTSQPGQGIPTHYERYPDDWDPESGEEPDIAEVPADFIGELSRRLAHGSVAVLQEVYVGPGRDLSARSVAVNARGERVRLELSEILERAADLGDVEAGM